MPQTTSDQMRLGILSLIAACAIWGVSGLYFKLLSHLPPIEVLAHRTFWSAVFFVGVVAYQGRLPVLRAVMASRQILILAGAAVVISCNWFWFIWAIGQGRATEASLGYFIFPLVAVLLGRIFFGERLGALQWTAVGLAAGAVALLTWGLGVAPWISLLLAVTFGTYSAIKKRLSAGPVISVTGEVLLIAPLSLVMILGFGAADGAGIDRILAVGQPGGLRWSEILLLVASGPITALPLILFSNATRKVPLSTVGLVQYLNPTLQFLVATLIFAEPISRWHAIAFPLIWLALAIYTIATLRRGKGDRQTGNNPDRFDQDRPDQDEPDQESAARRLATHSSTEAVLPQNSRSEGSAKP
ncbi:EamA family transporter RarD [Marinovum sp. 2_MG-2023]|uniref:EamA family transporter RarD n=1 Tax=unclassified Marinovum TaxID=2647166 RepID=UPI0026E46ECF|nr:MULTISPECIES: EamA family transporter RarD [unclassified Marinovum]MDO6731951.1 EamA family transporter RarD [Marinovum sp. 2_MG-2023]MDO6781203.1 EamA family transporter RarD [Marinovum sp. 1_MG-2023]